MRLRKLANIIMVVAFIAAITVPFATMWLSDGSNSEQRNLASFPSTDLSRESIDSFPKDFDTYVNDRFGFRNLFLNIHSYLTYKVFHVSGAAKVLAGHGNWLFIFDEGSRPDILREGQLSKTDLDAWKRALNQRYTWLKSQGIDYRFMVGPEKNSIFPEYLPKRVRSNEPSRLQDLESFIGPPSYFVDPSAALKEEKSGDLSLYFHTDTHWTQYGAYIGYRELMRSLGRKDFAYAEPTFSTFTLEGGGDMSRMIRVPTSESVPVAKDAQASECSKPRQAQWPLGADAKNVTIFATICPGKQGTALVFRDSFFTSVIPFFSQNYGRVIYVWLPPNSQLLVKLVQQEKPSVVVEERVERSLYGAPTADLPEYLSKAKSEKDFTSHELQVQRERNDFLGADVRLKMVNGSLSFTAGSKTLASVSGENGSGGGLSSMQRTAQGVDVTGWAALSSERRQADFIVVTQGDRVAYVETPQWVQRRDVALTFDSDALAMSGFALHVPEDYLDSTPDLKVYAIRGTEAAQIADSN